MCIISALSSICVGYYAVIYKDRLFHITCNHTLFISENIRNMLGLEKEDADAEEALYHFYMQTGA